MFNFQYYEENWDRIQHIMEINKNLYDKTVSLKYIVNECCFSNRVQCDLHYILYLNMFCSLYELNPISYI